MIQRCILGLSLLIFANLVVAATPIIDHTFPSLPTQYRENQYQAIQKAFEERTNLFLKGRQFHSYKKNKPKAEIMEEFKHIQEWRNHSWFSDAKGQTLISRPDFIVAQDLLEKGYFRRPHLLPFQYNQTDAMYNSSTIIINGLRFLALEAPNAARLRNFFILLQNHQVAQLVRLTAPSENGREKSFAYWIGRQSLDPKTKQTRLNLPPVGNAPSYTLRYYAINSWGDHQGIDPKILLNALQNVRLNFDTGQELMACHCSGGVGRTGTFIAAYAILHEIDRQLANGVSPDAVNISIEKVVMQLSLQRFQMVAKPEQYVTLYRLVDLYLYSKEK